MSTVIEPINVDTLSQNEMRKRALIAYLHLSQWIPRKENKKLSKDVAVQHGAAEGAYKVTEDLFPSYKITAVVDGTPLQKTVATFPELNKMRAKFSALYVWCASHSLVWDGKGGRILSRDYVVEHKQRTAALIAELPTLKADIIAGYPAAIERARVARNGGFNIAQYPSAESLAEKFAVTADYEAIPATLSDDMPDEIRDIINTSIAQSIEARIQNATSDAWQRLYSVVGKFQETLSTPGAIFRDTLVDNVTKCCDLLQHMNVMKDATLENMRNEVLTKIAAFQPQTLRDNPETRAAAVTVAGNILATMRGTRSIEKVED